jgi:hypothetical protein
MEAVEGHMRAGGAFRDLSLPFAKKWGLETYRASNPQWSKQMLAIAQATADAKKTLTNRQRMAARTHCPNGHLITPETTRMVRGRYGWKHRECTICRQESYQRSRSRYTAEQLEAAISQIRNGATIADVTSNQRLNIIRSEALTAALQQRPELGAIIRPLSAKNASDTRKQIWVKWRLANPRERPPQFVHRSRGTKIILLGPTLTGIIAAPAHEIFTAVDNAVPRNIDFHQRKEVMSEMMLAILEGRLTIEDCRGRYREFLRGVDRMFPMRYAGPSLDGPAFRDGKTLLIDTVSRGPWE